MQNIKKHDILVTGGYGFIGSNFINWLREQGNCVVTNIDKHGYASDPNNVTLYVPTYNKDITEDYFLDTLFNNYRYDAIFHFAAESHVDNSITGPLVFTKSNVLGTHNILESWRKAGAHGRFIHISTDEVYGHLKQYDDPFTENTPIQPRSPYAASKASSDLIVHSYYETYGCDVNITRCCNNYGPRQHKEKFIPKIITNLIKGDKIPVYGTGKNIREWIHVIDHVEAIWKVFTTGKPGEIYNIGSENECTNLEIVELICDLMNKETKDVIEFVEDRKGHDFRYAIDSTKIRNKLLWTPRFTDHVANIQETITWYTK